MTDVRSTIRTPTRLTAGTLARGGVATLLALAAPAVSFLPALTTGVHGSGAHVTFPDGYPLMLAVTVVVTAVACALGALLARRAALVAIPLGLALWLVIGLAIFVAGLALAHHTHLAQWGIALVAAVAAGLPLAARGTVPGLSRPAQLPPNRPSQKEAQP